MIIYAEKKHQLINSIRKKTFNYLVVAEKLRRKQQVIDTNRIFYLEIFLSYFSECKYYISQWYSFIYAITTNTHLYEKIVFQELKCLVCIRFEGTITLS